MVVDGSLNNPHILKDVTALSTNINSDKVTSDNANANTRAAGRKDSEPLVDEDGEDHA